MPYLFKILFVLLIIKPLVFIGLGLNIIQRRHLPEKGPAIIAANHNSHLDTLVLLALFPLRMVHKVRPVAAADYFLANPVIAWLSLNIIGIIPIRRSVKKADRDNIFSACHQALDKGHILIIFPEGSRGKPEETGQIKKGIYHLSQARQDCRVIPVVMRGLGRTLPKGTARLVPFNCDVVIGEPLCRFESAGDFVKTMTETYQALAEHCITQTEEPDE
ncbi:lysophospholipid acyltransferase family protein [Vibrio quintilis]|uniref:2-acyl-glycerophospho-ethanolamine acyltransferase n=1 Tax=Vibrio quintilis TaxID=1117707 RepID=A0A1M7YPW0_9VIBR|nr:lysophospholipid acyltransferase family protein [Vibrio quintilis]SHO54673.1 2-acyl-glycerophospho-ethanolamine acyltransferase [Vibrio quintilis]